MNAFQQKGREFFGTLPNTSEKGVKAASTFFRAWYAASHDTLKGEHLDDAWNDAWAVAQESAKALQKAKEAHALFLKLNPGTQQGLQNQTDFSSPLNSPTARATQTQQQTNSVFFVPNE